MSLLDDIEDTSLEVANARHHTRSLGGTEEDASGFLMTIGDDANSRFTVIKNIGSGAHGDADLVRDNRTGEKCVAKGFRVSEMTKTDLRYAFSEVRCMSLLSHPCIVHYIADFHTADNLVMVMEHCGGGDLQQQIAMRQRAGGHFKEHEAVFIFLQLTLALEHVHNLRMLHRDIKSANIFLTSEGIVKLGDFGYSKTYANTISADVAATFCGTPSYLAPELWNGNRYSKKADVWSLGIVLYEMLCLEKPFLSSNLGDLCSLVLKEVPPPPPAGMYSDELIEILNAMLAKDPNDRPSIRQLYECHPYLTTMMEKLRKVIANNTGITDELREEILRCVDESAKTFCRPVTPPQADMSHMPLFVANVEPSGDMSWEPGMIHVSDDALLVTSDSGSSTYPLKTIDTAYPISNPGETGSVFGVFFNTAAAPLFLKTENIEHTNEHLDCILSAIGV